MIHLNIPSFYYGLHTVASTLDIAKRHHPETRRWEADGNTIVDKQSQESVEIPKYSFVLFIGGNPTVVPFDLMSVLAMPSPKLVVPDLADIHAQDVFRDQFVNLSGVKLSHRLVLEGVNKDKAFLEYSTDIDPAFNYDRHTPSRPGEAKLDGKIRLNPGDTLFTYSFPRESLKRNAVRSGDIEYMPTSRSRKLTEVPASDSLDLTTSIHKRNWSKIWPRTQTI